MSFVPIYKTRVIGVKDAFPVGPFIRVGPAQIGPGISKPISLVFGKMISVILDFRSDIPVTTCPNGQGCLQERRLSPGRR